MDEIGVCFDSPPCPTSLPMLADGDWVLENHRGGRFSVGWMLFVSPVSLLPSLEEVWVFMT
jgi:hypothetical protein